MPHPRRSPRQIALAAAVGYLALGGAWILGSDAAVELIADSTTQLTRLQSIKGWAYIGITAVIAYALVRGLLWRDARLRDYATQFAVTVQSAPVGIALLDAQRRCLRGNPALGRLLGLLPHQLEGKALDQLLGAGDTEWLAAVAEPRELRVRDGSGNARWLRLQIADVDVDAGADGCASIALVEDFTPQHLQDARQRLAAVAFESRQPTLITDAAGRILNANRAYLQLCGYRLDELLGQNPRLLRSGLQDAHVYEGMWRELADHGLWEGELVNRRRDGSLYPLWQSITAVRDASGVVTHYVAHAIDLSERREIERTLHRLENFDPLTGLPNRGHFLQRIAAQQRAADGAPAACILLLDLDGFRRINDGFGPARGDAVLRDTAALLARVQPDSERCARISADVFALLLDGEPGEALGAATSLRDGLASLPSGAALHYPITACIGLLPLDRDGDASAQLARAETALHHAKQDGPGRVREYQPGMQSAAEARLAIASRLQQALERGDIVPYLQPQCDGDGRIVGAEALARWIKADGSIMPPGEFIATAEELGLIGRIGERMLECTAQLSAELERLGRPLRLAVNVSAQHMREPDFVARTLAIVRAAGASPQKLTLEITESLVIDDFGNAAARLDTLRDHGFRIAIDDFGTGYSSLSYLRQLPIDELKIDGSFLREAMADRTGELLFESVVAIGHTLGLSVVAEGVETREQAALARRCGKVILQGYLLGRPLPVERFVELTADPAPLPR